MSGDSAGPGESARPWGFDTSRPNAARVYDYLLGGKDNFAADRDAAAQLLSALPDAGRVARANRAFLAAAVGYVAGRGIGQYVDIGAGLPTPPNVHQCARTAVSDARVVYVDNDPVVLTHAHALMAPDGLVTAVSGDARKYDAILSSLDCDTLIDFSEPVCVLFVSMLHFLSADEADAAVAAFRERMAPGSYLVISAGHDDGRNAAAQEQIQGAYGPRITPTGRSAAEIAAYFGDFDLVPPGLVPLTEWPLEVLEPSQARFLRPASPGPAKATMLAGIGHKRS
ncbi:MAG TPA: SAM-dependent methyltransferase [Streptosporangiaceae bacterium]|nr:SAM-dependent methyltransferase [Streptosporangiaceae bacterium]